MKKTSFYSIILLLFLPLFSGCQPVQFDPTDDSSTEEQETENSNNDNNNDNEGDNSNNEGANSNDGTDNSNSINESIPTLGSIWYDCMVVGISNVTSSSADILLMDLTDWDEVKAADASTIIKEHSKNGWTDWHVPSRSEASMLVTNWGESNTFAQMNSSLTIAGGNPVLVEDGVRYLCEDCEKSFTFTTSTRYTQVGSTRGYNMRLVRTYHLIFNER